MPVSTIKNATAIAVAFHHLGVPKRTLCRAFGWDSKTLYNKLRPDSSFVRELAALGFEQFCDKHGIDARHARYVNAVNPAYGRLDPELGRWLTPANREFHERPADHAL